MRDPPPLVRATAHFPLDLLNPPSPTLNDLPPGFPARAAHARAFPPRRRGPSRRARRPQPRRPTRRPPGRGPASFRRDGENPGGGFRRCRGARTARVFCRLGGRTQRRRPRTLSGRGCALFSAAAVGSPVAVFGGAERLAPCGVNAGLSRLRGRSPVRARARVRAFSAAVVGSSAAHPGGAERLALRGVDAELKPACLGAGARIVFQPRRRERPWRFSAVPSGPCWGASMPGQGRCLGRKPCARAPAAAPSGASARLLPPRRRVSAVPSGPCCVASTLGWSPVRVRARAGAFSAAGAGSPGVHPGGVEGRAPRAWSLPPGKGGPSGEGRVPYPRRGCAWWQRRAGGRGSGSARRAICCRRGRRRSGPR